jgi:hypothetical protein
MAITEWRTTAGHSASPHSLKLRPGENEDDDDDGIVKHFLGRINKSKTDPELLLAQDQHVDRVPIDNTSSTLLNVRSRRPPPG